MNDPLSGTPWSEAALVSGFARSPPNHTLMEFAAALPQGLDAPVGARVTWSGGAS